MRNTTGSHIPVGVRQASAGRSEVPASKALTVRFFFARQPIVSRFLQILRPPRQGALPNQS
jgi:hypothetical protein